MSRESREANRQARAKRLATWASNNKVKAATPETAKEAQEPKESEFGLGYIGNYPPVDSIATDKSTGALVPQEVQ